MLKIIVEAVVYSLLYAAFILLLMWKQSAEKQLYNYPPNIQNRASRSVSRQGKRWRRREVRGDEAPLFPHGQDGTGRSGGLRAAMPSWEEIYKTYGGAK